MSHIKNRIDNLCNSLSDGIVLIHSGSDIIRNGDSYYQFRASSNFYYFTSLNIPNATLLIDTSIKKTILFTTKVAFSELRWAGPKLSNSELLTISKVDEILDIKELKSFLSNKIKEDQPVYVCSDHQNIYANSEIFDNKTKLKDISYLINKSRIIKDDAEIDLLIKAAEISQIAHLSAYRLIHEGMNECEIHAELLRIFVANGAKSEAYTSIVASGHNACYLHYIDNNKTIDKNDLVLIDAGCEYKNYASDITRTYPASGVYTAEAQAIYELVLEANIQAINSIKPGSFALDPNKIAIKILAQGIIDLGFSDLSVDDLIENNIHKEVYPHRTSHWIGLDVHDASRIEEDDVLKPGMLLTVEPGLYLDANYLKKLKIPDKYLSIGIRIEDTILVTENGYKNISDNILKKSIEEIHAIKNN